MNCVVRFALGTGRRLFLSPWWWCGAGSVVSFFSLRVSERAMERGEGEGLGARWWWTGGAAERKQRLWRGVDMHSAGICTCVFICVCMTLWWLVDGWWAAPWPCMGSWAHGCLLRTKAVVALVIHLCRLSGSYFILYFKLHSSNNDFYSFTSPILSYLLEIVLELI